jgi:hypothetical protein
MFLNNKYTALYYKIIASAQERNHIKILNDGYQTHHIIPRCFGGTNDITNLVVLTYKEHRVCHHLLINMTSNDAKYKMMYAYKLFNRQYDTSGAPTPQTYSTPESYIKMVKTRKRQGTYKTGKDNIFSTSEIVEQVRQRMIDNNPMKASEQRQRMSLNNNNPNVRPIVVEGITFSTIGAASRHFNTTPYLLKKRYDYRLLDS